MRSRAFPQLRRSALPSSLKAVLCRASSTRAPPPAADKRVLMEDVLGFASAKTHQLAQVVKGRAAPAARVASETMEESLRRKQPPPTRPHKPWRRQRQRKDSEALQAAFEAAFREAEPICQPSTPLHAVSRDVYALLCTPPSTQQHAPPRFLRAADILASLLPEAPATLSQAELVEMIVAHPSLMRAALLISLRDVCAGQQRSSAASPPPLPPPLLDIQRHVLPLLLDTPAQEPPSNLSSRSVACELFWLSLGASHALHLQWLLGSQAEEELIQAARDFAVASTRAMLALLRREEAGAQAGQKDALSWLRAVQVANHAVSSLLLLRRRPSTASAAASADSGAAVPPPPDVQVYLLAAQLSWALQCLRGCLHLLHADGGCKEDLRGRDELLRALWDCLRTCEGGLWQRGLTPPSAVTSSQRHAMTHRTIHSSLNLSLEAMRHCLSQGSADGVAQPRADCDRVRQLGEVHPDAVYRLLSACTQLVEAGASLANALDPHTHPSAPRSEHDRAPQAEDALALIARLGMSVDEKVLLESSTALGMEWTTPVKISTIARPKAAPKNTTDADHWRAFLFSCDKLRQACAELVCTTFTQLTQRELTTPGTHGHREGPSSRDGVRPPVPAQRFLRMLQVQFFAMGRLHYLCTQGLTRGPVEQHKALLGNVLQVFLLLRATAALPEEMGEGTTSASRGPPSRTPQTCGTSLGQAMEVAFFLSVYQHLLSSTHSSGENRGRGDGGASAAHITASAVDAYVAEMFHSLGHSTAKQLWHLRSTGALHFFTGQQRNREYISAPHVWLRHVQSTLATVHAHVVHPSLLWMPLWQLQEMVFLFAHHTKLFYSEAGDAAEPQRDGIHREAGQPQFPSLNEHAEQMATWADSGGTVNANDAQSPVFTRAKIDINGSATDLSRVHEYLVLRLFVVSNVLRAYRDVVSERLTSSAQRTPHADAQAPEQRAHGGAVEDRFLASLAALAEREPAAECEKRRAHRPWARAIAEDLFRQLPSLPAAAEGLADRVPVGKRRRRAAGQRPVRNRTAILRVLSRQEGMISRGLASHVFINAIADMRRRGGRDSDAGTMVENAAEDGEREEGVCVLLLSRAAVDTPLGFMLDAGTATLTRVVGAEGGPGDSPFAHAVSAKRGVVPPALSSAEDLVGWRVVDVDGVAVRTGAEVGTQLRGKCSVQLTLRRAG